MEKKIFVGLLAVLAIVLAFVFLSPVKNNQTQESKNAFRPVFRKGDFNKSGSIDFTDQEMVRQNTGCEKTAACWQKIIGKTIEGDNPIYASDLDLDGNGIINSSDSPKLK